MTLRIPHASVYLVCRIAGSVASRPGMSSAEVRQALLPHATNVGYVNGGMDFLVDAKVLYMDERGLWPTSTGRAIVAGGDAIDLALVHRSFMEHPGYRAVLEALARDGSIPAKLDLAACGRLFGPGVSVQVAENMLRYPESLGRAWRDGPLVRDGQRMFTDDEVVASVGRSHAALAGRSDGDDAVAVSDLLPAVCRDLRASPHRVTPDIIRLAQDGAFQALVFNRDVRKYGKGFAKVLGGTADDPRKVAVPMDRFHFADGDAFALVRVGDDVEGGRPAPVPPVPSGQASPSRVGRTAPTSKVEPGADRVAHPAAEDIAPSREDAPPPARPPEASPPQGAVRRFDFAPVPSIETFEAIGFGVDEEGAVTLPYGWTETAPDDWRGDPRACAWDECGRERVRLEEVGPAVPPRGRLLERFTVEVVDPIADRMLIARAGMARVAIRDAGQPVLVWGEFEADDVDEGDRNIQEVTSWLALVRPDHADPVRSWDGQPLPRDDAGALRFPPPSTRGTVPFPAAMRPCRITFEALGFDFAGPQADGTLEARLPPGWTAGSRHYEVVDGKGRARTERDVGRGVRLVPRFRVEPVAPGTPQGVSIGLGLGRCRVAVLDCGKVVASSAEFRIGDDARRDQEARRMSAWLELEHPDHADPCAYWSEDGLTG